MGKRSKIQWRQEAGDSALHDYCGITQDQLAVALREFKRGTRVDYAPSRHAQYFTVSTAQATIEFCIQREARVVPDSTDYIVPYNYIFIPSASSSSQGEGHLKPLFTQLVRFAQTLNMERLELHASEVGRYAWARYGFIPYSNTWNSMRRQILEMGRDEFGVSGIVLTQLEEMCGDENPRAIRRIAALQHPEIETPLLREEERYLPLGKALLMHRHKNMWLGTLNLANKADVDYALTYCGVYEPLASIAPVIAGHVTANARGR